MFKKYLVIFLDIITIYAGFFLSILIVKYLRYRPEKFFPEQSNWRKTPISDIIISDDKCPLNYEPLIESIYGGIYTYCDCTNSTNKKYKGKIFLDICEKEQGNANCTINIGEEGTIINKWRGKIICVKRLTNKFYYEDYIYRENKTSCNEYLNNYVDTEKNRQCKNMFNDAINYLEINYKNLHKNESDMIKELQLNDNYSIYYSKNYPGGNLIIDIFLTANDGICVSSDEGIFSQDNHEFNKLKGSPNCTTVISGNKYDFRYKLIDQNVNYIETLKDNNITKYDHLNINQNQTLKLYSIPYIGIKRECYSIVELSDFYTNQIILTQIGCIKNCILSGVITLIFTISCISCKLSFSIDCYIHLISCLIFFIYLFCEYRIYDNTIYYSIFHSFTCLNDFSYNNYWKMYLHIWLPKIFIGVNIIIYTFISFNKKTIYDVLKFY